MDPCITGHWSWKGCQNWSFIHIRNGRPYFCGARADPALLGLPSLGAVGQSVVARSAFLSGRHHASCQWSAKNVVPNYLNWEYGPVRQRRSCQRWKGTVPASERRTACVCGGVRGKRKVRSPGTAQPRLSPAARRSLLRLRRGAASRRRRLWGAQRWTSVRWPERESAGRSEKEVPELATPNAGRNLPIRIRRLPEVVNMGQLSPRNCVPDSRQEPPARSRDKSQAANRRRRRWETRLQS